MGAPTEAALVVMVEKLGLVDSGLHSSCLAQRTKDPETHGMPVTKAYAGRWGPQRRGQQAWSFQEALRGSCILCETWAAACPC